MGEGTVKKIRPSGGTHHIPDLYRHHHGREPYDL